MRIERLQRGTDSSEKHADPNRQVHQRAAFQEIRNQGRFQAQTEAVRQVEPESSASLNCKARLAGSGDRFGLVEQLKLEIVDRVVRHARGGAGVEKDLDPLSWKS